MWSDGHSCIHPGMNNSGTWKENPFIFPSGMTDIYLSSTCLIPFHRTGGTRKSEILPFTPQLPGSPFRNSELGNSPFYFSLAPSFPRGGGNRKMEHGNSSKLYLQSVQKGSRNQEPGNSSVGNSPFLLVVPEGPETEVGTRNEPCISPARDFFRECFRPTG